MVFITKVPDNFVSDKRCEMERIIFCIRKEHHFSLPFFYKHEVYYQGQIYFSMGLINRYSYQRLALNPNGFINLAL